MLLSLAVYQSPVTSPDASSASVAYGGQRSRHHVLVPSVSSGVMEFFMGRAQSKHQAKKSLGPVLEGSPEEAVNKLTKL